MISIVDRSIEHALQQQAKKYGIDTSDAKQVERMVQTEYPDGTIVWMIDKQIVLRFGIENVGKDIIRFTVTKINPTTLIIQPDNKLITVN